MTVYNATYTMKDTAANFTSYNPTLAKGKIGYETDTGKLKTGDGSTAWTSLGYTNLDDSTIDAYVPEGIEKYASADGMLHLSDASGKVEGMDIGASANVVGSGFACSGSKTAAVNIFSDDGGADFAGSGSDIKNLRSRLLITHAQTGGNSYFSGFLGHLKYAAVSDTCTASFRAGVRGYVESINGSTLGDMTAGVVGLVDAPSGAIIGTGYVSSFLAGSFNLGGTHTGKAVALDVRKPQTAGTFDALLHIDSSSGVVNTTASGSQDTSKWLIVYYNDTPMKMPLYAIS